MLITNYPSFVHFLGKLNYETLTVPVKTVHSTLDQMSGKESIERRKREGGDKGRREGENKIIS